MSLYWHDSVYDNSWMQTCVLYLKFRTLITCLCCCWCQHDEEISYLIMLHWNSMLWLMCLHSYVTWTNYVLDKHAYDCNTMQNYDGIAWYDWSYDDPCVVTLHWYSLVQSCVIDSCSVDNDVGYMNDCHNSMSVTRCVIICRMLGLPMWSRHDPWVRRGAEGDLEVPRMSAEFLGPAGPRGSSSLGLSSRNLVR